MRCCYEAGPIGFDLYRHLVDRGIDCSVVAPGLVPQRPSDRVKTDPRDARKLARLLAGGLLEPIHVPSPEFEAARDLVRAREDARLDRMHDRHRLSKFCPRHGRLLPTSSWTVVRRKWLGERQFEHACEQLTFDTYVHAVDLVDARIDKLEQAIRETAEQFRLGEQVTPGGFRADEVMSALQKEIRPETSAGDLLGDRARHGRLRQLRLEAAPTSYALKDCELQD